MKLSTLLVAGSLALNAALAVVYFSRSRPAVPSAEVAAVTASGSKTVSQPKAGAAKPSSSAEKKNDAATWAALNKTGDLRALAARLKAAGFSPDVVRAAVSAQLYESFKTRRAQMLPKIEDRPFWKTDSNGGSLLSGIFSDPKYRAATRELSLEHSRLLKEILGPDANASSADYDEYLVRRFGNLPKDKIEQLQRLDQDYNELRSDAQRAARGLALPEDREKLAILEREKRADLAQMLTPEEAEDYLMRSSQSTSRLRQTLTVVNASEEEFKALYRVQAGYDEKYGTALGLGGPTTPEQRNERLAAQAEVEEQFKAALGETRYAEFARAADREYQQLSGMAKQAGIADAAAIAVVTMRQNVLNESNRIFDDESLSSDQKRVAIQGLGQTARSEVNAALGADVAQKYLQIANWITQLERGSAVKMTSGVNGSSSSSRNVPPAGRGGAPDAVQSVPELRKNL
ncbi:MAG: hypothetical protein ABIO94_07970 [Opitutaceae bacterium]